MPSNSQQNGFAGGVRIKMKVPLATELLLTIPCGKESISARTIFLKNGMVDKVSVGCLVCGTHHPKVD